jgi:hypothetical protein
MKEKILLWLIKRMCFSSYAERTLMFKLQCSTIADKLWEEVKQMREESGCSDYES